MSGSGSVMRLLYGTVPGRAVLQLIQNTRAARVFVRFLHAPVSRLLIPAFAKANHIPEEEWRGRRFAAPSRRSRERRTQAPPWQRRWPGPRMPRPRRLSEDVCSCRQC